MKTPEEYETLLAIANERIKQLESKLTAEAGGGEKALWGCYMEGTDELGISDDILLSVHSTPAGAHENSMRMQKEYGGKHYTDKVVIHA